MPASNQRRSELGTEHVREMTEKAKVEQKKKKYTRNRRYDSEERLPRVTYEFPQELIDRVKQITEEIGQEAGAKVAVYQVARLLMEAGIKQYEDGELKIRTYPKEINLFPD